MKKFTAYVVNEHSFAEFEVTNKIRTNVRGHYTYMLQGITEKGNRANALVNGRQFEEFDVPMEDKIITKKRPDKKNREKMMNSYYDCRKIKRPKSKRKVYNEEIEKWIAEKYGVDMDSIENDKK